MLFSRNFTALFSYTYSIILYINFIRKPKCDFDFIKFLWKAAIHYVR